MRRRIELVSTGDGRPGEGPVINAIQLNAEGETSHQSRWTKFSDFLELFGKLPKDEDIMAALEDGANGDDPFRLSRDY